MLNDFARPTGYAVHEPALGGFLGVLEEALVLRQIVNRFKARVRLLDVARYEPALYAVGRVDAQHLDLAALHGEVVLILRAVVPKLHDQGRSSPRSGPSWSAACRRR